MPAMIGERPMTTAEIQKRYKERHPERVAVRNKAYAQANPDAVRRSGREAMRRRDPELKRAYNKAWREKNKEYHAKRNAEWYKNNPEKVLDIVLKTKFKITLQQYSAMLWSQDGVCAICKKECKTGRRLAVDHCHSTGKIRGLLCTGCNTALGSVLDNIETLRSMIEYLEK